MSGYIYVMECCDTKLVKIGITANPAGRFRGLCNASGRNLVVVYLRAHAKAREIEAMAHRTLKECRGAGEWFDVPAEQAISVVEATIEANKERDWIILARVRSLNPRFKSHRERR